MTYNDLLIKLKQFTPEQLSQTALVRLEFAEEIIGIESLIPSSSDDSMGDVVDEGQYLLSVEY
jgi:hypothetical protein